MASPDPFRVLGLPRDATQAEVKRAYRRLAKAFHPDAAGDGATARFLEIQAAYETLVGANPAGGRRTRTRPAPGREPWRADPDRAREAREAGRARARRGPTDGQTTADRGRSAGGGRTAGEGGRSAGDSEPGGRRRPHRATPGSTTYDGADREPFDPDWSGASWYGTTSGTYWTVNPREYADPRKHGPEYEARARRRTARGDDDAGDWSSDAAGSSDAGSSAGPSAAAGSSAAGSSAAAASSAGVSDAAAGASEWRAAGRPDGATGSAPTAGNERPPRSTAWAAPRVDRRPRHATVPPGGAPPAPPAGPPARSLGGLLDDARRTVSGRIGLALAGWVPLGIALAVALGESTGCSPVVEGCEGPFGLAAVLGQGSVVALLLLLPRLAVVATLGTIAMVAAALPAVAALSIANGARDPAGVVPPFVLILVVAWAAGIAIGAARALARGADRRRPPVP